MDINLKTPCGRFVRWKLRLQELDFEVLYRSEIKHFAPDGLSLLDTNGYDDTDKDD